MKYDLRWTAELLYPDFLITVSDAAVMSTAWDSGNDDEDDLPPLSTLMRQHKMGQPPLGLQRKAPARRNDEGVLGSTLVFMSQAEAEIHVQRILEGRNGSKKNIGVDDPDQGLRACELLGGADERDRGVIAR